MIKQIKTVLFVGLGGVGQRHLRNLRSVMGDSVRILAYRKKNAQFVLNNRLEIVEGKQLNQTYHVCNVNSLEEAFAENVDTVFICNPTSMHAEILKRALEAGCNVFIEKPIAESIDAIKEIDVSSWKSNQVVFVGYQNRFHPCIIKLKQLLEVNAIGNIVSVFAEIGESVKTWHKYEDYKQMYACRKELGGGIVITQIHELDYLYYLFGMPESVYAVGGTLSDLDIDVEDVTDILMKYKRDSLNIPITVHEDYLQNPAHRCCKVIGTKGKIELDLIKATICLYDEQGNVLYNEEFHFDRNDMFLSELKSFIESIQTGSEPAISFEEGKKSLEIAMAARKSMQTGMPVKL